MTVLELAEELLKCIREGKVSPTSTVLSGRMLPITNLTCDRRINSIVLEESDFRHSKQ